MKITSDSSLSARFIHESLAAGQRSQPVQGNVTAPTGGVQGPEPLLTGADAVHDKSGARANDPAEAILSLDVWSDVAPGTRFLPKPESLPGISHLTALVDQVDVLTEYLLSDYATPVSY